MLDFFDYYGHICISFTMLGLSVFDFLVSSRVTLGGPLLDVPAVRRANRSLRTEFGEKALLVRCWTQWLTRVGDTRGGN